MPRLTSPLWYRGPPRLPFKFQELIPLQLQNEVKPKSDKSADAGCLEEMAVMFACMKKAEFKEAKCGPEVEKFLTCFNARQSEKAEVRAREEAGQFVVGRNVKNLTTKQLNHLLKKYPQQNQNPNAEKAAAAEYLKRINYKATKTSKVRFS